MTAGSLPRVFWADVQVNTLFISDSTTFFKREPYEPRMELGSGESSERRRENGGHCPLFSAPAPVWRLCCHVEPGHWPHSSWLWFDLGFSRLSWKSFWLWTGIPGSARIVRGQEARDQSASWRVSLLREEVTTATRPWGEGAQAPCSWALSAVTSCVSASQLSQGQLCALKRAVCGLGLRSRRNRVY